MLATRRILGFAVLVAFVGAELASCLVVPTRPLSTAPFTLTIDGDRIAWFNCYDEPVEKYSISTGVRGEIAGQEDSIGLFAGEAELGTSIEMEPETLITPQTSFPDLPVLEESDLRVTELSGTVTVYLRFSGEDQHAEMAFKDVDVDDLASGKYIYYTGEVRDEPCEF